MKAKQELSNLQQQILDTQKATMTRKYLKAWAIKPTYDDELFNAVCSIMGCLDSTLPTPKTEIVVSLDGNLIIRYWSKRDNIYKEL